MPSISFSMRNGEKTPIIIIATVKSISRMSSLSTGMVHLRMDLQVCTKSSSRATSITA